MNFTRYFPPSQKALEPVLDTFSELLSRGLSFDEIANRMNVSNAQVCVYFHHVRCRLGLDQTA
jgi:DNA-binding NarL/FixJ family response regulator